MVEIRENFSRRVLVRLAVVLVLVATVLSFNFDFVFQVYVRNQPTATGWIINGGILALFLLGLVRIIAVFLRYMREEKALARFVRSLDKEEAGSGRTALELDRNTLIGRRYEAILNLSRENVPIHQAALASAQVARESTLISLPKFVNNILILTGVFGTIVSLSIALIGASNLLGLPQEGPDAMGLVIHGMSTALSTTMTAIVCYLIYGYFYLKLTDAQTHLLSELEQVTTLYLVPRFAHPPDALAQRLSGLVKSLYEVAEMMRLVQTDYVQASSQLHSLISALNQRTKPLSEDLRVIKGILREGFRLPEPEIH